MTSPGIANFLLARIAEDEAVAKTATMGPWEDRLGMLFGQTDVPEREILVAAQAQAWNGDHITRWDPARVLAECDAKRQIMEECASWDGGEGSGLDPVLQLLALPYASHPDYDEEWRP